MNKLNICFIGLGSIAKRHIRNLQSICVARNLEISIDAYRHSASDDVPAGISKVYHDLENVPDNYDIVFITNPTKFHLESLQQIHGKGKHFFIEKPVVAVDQIGDAERFMLKEGSVYYVACPLRYNAVIQYIRNEIATDDVISIRSISSSFLPDWRPETDYRDTYSAHRSLGGGVSIDLIHEWDYLTYLFGWPEKLYYMKGKKSLLEIDSDDYAIYIAEYYDKILELHLDYFGRKTIRQIELFTNEDTIIGDLVQNRISFKRACKNLNFHEERDDYQKKELEHFLDMVEGLDNTENGFLHGLKVLKLTQGIL